VAILFLFLFIRVDEPAGDSGIDGDEFKSGIPAEFLGLGAGGTGFRKEGIKEVGGETLVR